MSNCLLLITFVKTSNMPHSTTYLFHFMRSMKTSMSSQFQYCNSLVATYPKENTYIASRMQVAWDVKSIYLIKNLIYSPYHLLHSHFRSWIILLNISIIVRHLILSSHLFAISSRPVHQRHMAMLILHYWRCMHGWDYKVFEFVLRISLVWNPNKHNNDKLWSKPIVFEWTNLHGMVTRIFRLLDG